MKQFNIEEQFWEKLENDNNSICRPIVTSLSDEFDRKKVYHGDLSEWTYLPLHYIPYYTPFIHPLKKS